MDNTNFQTIHQMGNAINNVVRQAMGRDNVQNIDMDYVTVAQRKRAVEEIITGNIVSFVTNIENALDYLIAQINPVQSGSGVPSPENIRPISGWNSVQITRAGKNLFPLYTGEPTTNRNITFTYNSDGSITVSGANTTPSSSSLSITLIRGMRILKPGRYKKEALTNGFYTYVQYVVSSSSWSTVPGGGAASDEFEITQEIYDNYEIVIRVGVSGGTSYDSPTTFYPYIYRDNETDFTWVSPTRNNYEITFPTDAGTVYGGTLTVNEDGSGTLVVTDANIASYNGETLPSTWISDRDVYTPDTSPTTGAQVVYKLDTPLTYNLTELEVIETLIGTNNIWADTGDVTVLYKNYEEVI